MKAPYMPYQNRCALCGESTGSLSFWYTTKYEPGLLKPAHQFAHTITVFECNACGAQTFYEQIPVIVHVVRKEDVEVNK